MQNQYSYLIIGGGMTGDSAARRIREIDARGSIGIISQENDPPYDRPPLTKGLWKDKPLESIWRNTTDQHAKLHLGRRVASLDLPQKSAVDEKGDTYTYDKLLLATGGRPRRLPFGGDDILYYRAVSDYRILREWAGGHQRCVVIGSGFIGSEIAAALSMNGKEVVMVFPGKGIGDRIFPPDLSQFVTNYFRQHGVRVVMDDSVSGLEKKGQEFIVRTKGGQELITERVIAGIGIEPNVELAAKAGLRVENGIVVDEFLRTSHPDVYAAGDVASFQSPALQARVRVEHEDNANTMGRLAGQNMAGIPEAYVHLPFFYSDLFDLGYEAVGELESRLDVMADWKEPFREGVIYYLRDGRVRGVLLWNVWGQVDAARALIAEQRKVQPEELRHRLLKAA
jgi:NADPH-dependent 2,4-dienoyl-CoA reductase/sulfur reductase-like enzyme